MGGGRPSALAFLLLSRGNDQVALLKMSFHDFVPYDDALLRHAKLTVRERERLRPNVLNFDLVWLFAHH
jgi:hypothetical protein